VTANESRLTALPDGLLAEIERRYALGSVGTAEPLVGGYANDVFSLRADGSTFVLRIKHPPIDPVSIRWEHDVLRLLAERVAEIPAPVAARDGTTFFRHDRFAVWLLPHLRGVPARGDDREHAMAAARLLAHFHAAGLDLDVQPRPNHRRRLRDLPFPEAGGLPTALREWLPLLHELRSEAIRFVTELAASGRALTTGLVHGDVFPGNVLIDAGRATGLLDWEEANVDWQVYDLAVGAWYFARDGAELEAAALRRFVTAYREAGGPVPPAEDDLLVPFIRVKRVLEVLRAPTDRHVDWEEQRVNLVAAERLR
jgi:Ser/Thr protein kinase RdoA (MazF antagonist)